MFAKSEKVNGKIDIYKIEESKRMREEQAKLAPLSYLFLTNLPS